MSHISLEVIFGIIVVVTVGLSFLGKLIPKRKPKEKRFKCFRCGAVSNHNERTMEAWRNNKTTFFCQACHVKWLQSRPPQLRKQFSSLGSTGSNSGCLGMVMLMAFVPLTGYFLVRIYA
jgi:uncharacterized protein YlaI